MVRVPDEIMSLRLRMWGGKGGGTRSDREKSRADNFAVQLSCITQVCLASGEIEIPYLSGDQAADAIEKIASCQKQLSVFAKRIKETRK
jgi:hypothetical protein